MAATGAPIIPLLQGRETVVVAAGVTGLEDSLDATYLFHFGALAKESAAQHQLRRGGLARRGRDPLLS